MRVLVFSLLVAGVCAATPGFGQNEDADALVNAGDVLFKLNEDKQEALEKYREALQLTPTHVRANYMAGLSYLRTSRKSWALNYLLKAYTADPDFVPELKIGADLYPDLTYLIGRAFQVGENYTRAEDYYEKFQVQLEHNAASRMAMLKKADAARAATRRIFECQNALELKKNALDLHIAGINEINSPYAEYGPVFTPDGLEMYFTSRRPGRDLQPMDGKLQFFEDIYVSRKDNKGKWGEPEQVKEWCTPFNESVLCISPDGKTMVLSMGKDEGDLFFSKRKNDGRWEKPEKAGSNINSDSRETSACFSAKGDKLYFASDRPDGFGGLDLYVSEKKSNGKWASAVNLGSLVNTSYDEEAPSINAEGNMLIFSSKGHKSIGGYDIFMAKWDTSAKAFKVPENMGVPINSVEDDHTYNTDPDGQAYYASFREKGLGDMDIFVLRQGPPVPEEEKKQREEFKQIAKVQAPLMEDRVNTMATDTSAVQAVEADRIAKLETAAKVEMAKEVVQAEAPAATAEVPKTAQAVPGGNFEVLVMEPGNDAGEAASGQGYFKYDPGRDMEAVAPAKKETIVRVLILDTDTRLPLDGELTFTDQDTKEEIKPLRVRNGVYELAIVNHTAKDFMVSVQKEGFHFKNIMVNVPAASATRSILLARNIELKKHTLNKPRILRNVYFDFDEAELSERSVFELEMLKKMMEENQRLIIEVAGHADFMGVEKYNLELSQKRAEKVVEYLASKGIDKGRLRAQGFGEAKPAPGTDETENGRSLNRRTEFMILAQ